MDRPDFLDCTTDKEWEDWYRMQKRTGHSLTPANTVRDFCGDCTEKFFNYNAEKGLCFQARIQDGETTVEAIQRALN